MKVYVYIDGFNLYYRALRKHPQFKWLDVSKAAKEILSRDDEIERIRYFTADVSPRAGDPGAPARQQAYFAALRTIPNLTQPKGSFLTKTKCRPLVGNEATFVRVHDTEEKGSDVNLATHLMNDAHLRRFDAALVLSQDTDLIETLRIVKHDLKLVVGVGWLDASAPGRKHRKVSDFIRHLRPDILAKSQFPDPVIGKGGKRTNRPTEWAHGLRET